MGEARCGAGVEPAATRKNLPSMNSLGVFEHHQDVGEPLLAGNAVYDATDQTYTLSSAGVSSGSALDQFHFVWKRLRGDFIVQATVRFVGDGHPRRRLGIMARAALS